MRQTSSPKHCGCRSHGRGAHPQGASRRRRARWRIGRCCRGSPVGGLRRRRRRGRPRCRRGVLPRRRSGPRPRHRRGGRTAAVRAGRCHARRAAARRSARPRVYAAWDELGGPRSDGDNDLEPAAIAAFPELATWRDRIREAAGVAPTLAGSGATWFLRGHHDLDVALADAAIVSRDTHRRAPETRQRPPAECGRPKRDLAGHLPRWRW